MNLPFDRNLLKAALRSDLNSFIQRTVQTVTPGTAYLPNWHVQAVAYHLQQCAEGKIKRLLITLPPRHLKSLCASVAFPAWLLGKDPTRRIVCASYGTELAGKHARDCRSVMETDWYREVFPGTRLEKMAEFDFETSQKGCRFSASVGGALTGRGGSIVIVDDPIKPADVKSDIKRNAVNDWFDGTLYSRLDNKKDDVIIVLMQRLHVEDLVGYLKMKDPDWVHLDLPAIAEEDAVIPIGPNQVHYRKAGDVLHHEREPFDVLMKTKEHLGSAEFAAQYQQRPVPVEGNLVKAEWFKTYDELPPFHPGYIVQSWDTASKEGELNDYSVCTTWLVKGNDYYLKHVLRERLDYPSLKKKAILHSREMSAHHVLIEDRGSGIQLIQDLKADHRSNIKPIARSPKLDKVTRMSNQSPRIEEGRVHLPRKAPWLTDFKSEMLAFPQTKHDDQVDSVSQFLEWIADRHKRTWRSGRSVGLF